MEKLIRLFISVLYAGLTIEFSKLAVNGGQLKTNVYVLLTLRSATMAVLTAIGIIKEMREDA